MNRAQEIKILVRTLEQELELIQKACQHPNLDDTETDDLFSDPFSNNGDSMEFVEYTCPDCLAVILK